MALGGDGELGDATQLVFVEDPGIGLGVIQLHRGVVAIRPPHDLERLVAQAGVEHLQRLLGDDVGVGLDLAGDHHLAEAESAFDDDPILRAVARIGGERDAGLVGVHHLLDDDRHRRVAGESPAGAVGDNAGTEQRHPAAEHRV